MSAVPKIIEGPWEEVVKHANEFHGRHVKVIVGEISGSRSDHPGFDTSLAAVKAWIEELRKWALNRPAVQFPDDSRDGVYADRLGRQL